MDKEDIIANKARKSISNFCMEECKSYCCRKNYLVMNKKQLNVVVGNKKEEYKDQIKEIEKDKFSLFLGKSDKPCPSLNKDFKCNIYNNKLRPKACSNFPLFLDKKTKTALLSPRCLAVRVNLLFPYVKKLQGLGYKILEAGEISRFEGNMELTEKIIKSLNKKP